MLKTGFAKEIITPERGVALCGYFNPRPNTGAYDDIAVKALVIKNNASITAIVSADLCFFSTAVIDEVKEKIKEYGLRFGEKILFAATHTHTAPYVNRFFGADPDKAFINGLVEKTALALVRAYNSLAPAEMLSAKTSCDTLAFNRRYFMKDGKVLTNPGKLNPKIVKPEGPIDSEIPVIAFRQDGILSAVLVNIVNHTDTIGGDFVSADWPGRMEREIQSSIGYDVPVITLIGCSGNINHLDVKSGASQTCLTEACRIGKAYGNVVFKAIGNLKPVSIESLKVTTKRMTVPYRTISTDEVERAKAILKKVPAESSGGDMTSEGLATGDGPVARFFAEQLVYYKKHCSGKKREFTLVSIKFDDKVGFVSLPGEPFTEIGLAIKKGSKFKSTFVVSLGMGCCGYIPLKECFGRGGYEILPVEAGNPREDTAERFIAEASKLLAK